MQAAFKQLRIGPLHRRLQVNKSTQRHGAPRRLQGGQKMLRIKRRVNEDDVHAGRVKLLECRHTVATHHVHRRGFQLGLDALELQHQLRVVLHQAYLFGTARSRLKTQYAGAGKSVHTPPACQVLAEPVEQSLAHAVRRGAQARLVSHRQLGALPQATNNAHLVRLHQLGPARPGGSVVRPCGIFSRFHQRGLHGRVMGHYPHPRLKAWESVRGVLGRLGSCGCACTARWRPPSVGGPRR